MLHELINQGHASSVFNNLHTQYKTDDIEVALTKLHLDKASQETSKKQIEGEVCAEIGKYFKTYTVNQGLIDRKPWLKKIVEKVFQAGDIVISLNYDCVLEGILDLIGKWTPNGGYGNWITNQESHEFYKSPTQILKIHGSCSFQYAPFWDNPDSGSIGFQLCEEFFPKSGKNKDFGMLDGKTYLIAPSYVKITAVGINYLMLEALEASAKAQKLIVIGSSLREEDAFLMLLVSNFFHQKDWEKRKMIILGPDADKIKEAIKQFWGVKMEDRIKAIKSSLQEATDQLIESLS
ncbi:MAG: hypothetical protein KDK66_07480 [Deltaproteobacteria bacterium]|nr:hypothetical protein [Deltaproteobacteria bacterium]